MTSALKRSLGQGALVFAKVKGYPHWPARVEEVRPGEKYRVLFFGTYEVGIIDIKCLFAYEENKARFARPNKKRFFMEALEEIEKRPGMKPPVTHVMGRVGGEKKPRDAGASTPVQPSAKDAKGKDQSIAGSAVKDAKAALQGSAKEAKVTQGKDAAKTTVLTPKEAKIKESRLTTGTASTGGPPLKETPKRNIPPEKKPSSSDNAEKRKSVPTPSGAKVSEKKLAEKQQQKRVSPTRPPSREAAASPKRKRSEVSTDKAEVATFSSPEEKPLQHSRAGRTIKPKKLDDEVIDIGPKSPRKAQTPSPDAKKPRQGQVASGGGALAKTEVTPLSSEQYEKAPTKGRRKTLPSVAESEHLDSPTAKRARASTVSSELDRKSGSPMHSPKASTTGAGTKKASSTKASTKESKANVVDDSLAAVAAAATAATATPAAGDDDDVEVCSECHRRSPRKHDHQAEDDGGGGTPEPNMSPSVVIETNPNLGTNARSVGVSVIQVRSLKQEARGGKGTAEDTPEGAKASRDETKVKGTPSADELKQQVAFLELTDKKIRANMGGERMDPDSALDAIVVLEGSFITAPALMRFPKILSTLRHVRRYPTNERLARKADFMYNKIKNYMMTVFISEDEKGA